MHNVLVEAQPALARLNKAGVFATNYRGGGFKWLRVTFFFVFNFWNFMQNAIKSIGNSSASYQKIAASVSPDAAALVEIMNMVEPNGMLVGSLEAKRADKANALTAMHVLYKELEAMKLSEKKINSMLDLTWKVAKDVRRTLVEDEDKSVTKNEVVPLSWTGCIAQLNRQTGIPALDQMAIGKKAAFFVNARRCEEFKAATGNKEIPKNPFTAMLIEESDPGYLERTINAWTHIGEGQEPVEMDFKWMAALNEMVVGSSAQQEKDCCVIIYVDALDMSEAGLERAFSDLQWINKKFENDPEKEYIVNEKLEKDSKKGYLFWSGGSLLGPEQLDSCKKNKESLGFFVRHLPPDAVEELFKEIIADMQASLKQCNSEDEQMAVIVHAFQKYELLPPNNDGNARSAILGINQICKERKLPPFLLDDPNAINYLSAGELVERSKAFQKLH